MGSFTKHRRSASRRVTHPVGFGFIDSVIAELLGVTSIKGFLSTLRSE